MMFNVLYTEFLKFRRSRILWLLPLSVIVTSVLEYSSILYQQSVRPSRVGWNWLMFNNFEYMTLFASPILFSLLTSYLFTKDVQDKTMSVLFTYSISRTQFLLGKCLLMVPLIAVILTAQFLCTLGIGVLTDLPQLTSDMLWLYVRALGSLILMTCAFLPLYAAIGIVAKSYVPNIVFGIVTLVVSVSIIQLPEYSILFPWSIPIVMMQGFIQSELPNAFNNGGDIRYTTGIIVLVLTFVIPFVFNLFYYRRMDVNNA